VEPEQALARPDRHDEFLQRGIPRALADAVDGALDLARAGTHGREAVGDGHAEVIVAVTLNTTSSAPRTCFFR